MIDRVIAQWQGLTPLGPCVLCDKPGTALAQAQGPRPFNGLRVSIGPAEIICLECAKAMEYPVTGAPACLDERGPKDLPQTWRPSSPHVFNRVPAPVCPHCGHETLAEDGVSFAAMRDSDSTATWVIPLCPCCGTELRWAQHLPVPRTVFVEIGDGDDILPL